MLVTIEEGSVGGFGSHILAYLVNEDLMRPALIVRTLALPDEFQDHDDPHKQYAQAGLNAPDLVRVVETSLARTA
jgi:1-deoxy-D-xylulose-5-phosphate synthase